MARTMGNHFHVQRHSEDEDIYVTERIYDALDYAATELEAVTDIEHEGISAYGEQGVFEAAYRCWQRSERYGDLAGNAENVVRQNNSPAEKRAPLYQGDGWQERLLEHAQWVAGKINRDGPDGFGIWECTSEIALLNEGTPDEMVTCQDCL
jgi:hypothetical protein